MPLNFLEYSVVLHGFSRTVTTNNQPAREVWEPLVQEAHHYWFTTGRLLCSKARLIRLLTASRRVLLNTKRCFNISFCGADGAPKCVRRCWCVILDSVIRPVLCFFVWLSKNRVNYWSILSVYIDKWCWHPSKFWLGYIEHNTVENVNSAKGLLFTKRSKN